MFFHHTSLKKLEVIAPQTPALLLMVNTLERNIKNSDSSCEYMIVPMYDK